MVESLSASLDICKGNTVINGFSHKGPVVWSFDISIVAVSRNKLLNSRQFASDLRRNDAHGTYCIFMCWLGIVEHKLFFDANWTLPCMKISLNPVLTIF